MLDNYVAGNKLTIELLLRCSLVRPVILLNNCLHRDLGGLED
jgi:hypothetical protein